VNVVAEVFDLTKKLTIGTRRAASSDFRGRPRDLGLAFSPNIAGSLTASAMLFQLRREPPPAATTPDNFIVGTAGDLAALCPAEQSDPMMATATGASPRYLSNAASACLTLPIAGTVNGICNNA
jgi:hypothetical protein